MPNSAPGSIEGPKRTAPPLRSAALRLIDAKIGNPATGAVDAPSSDGPEGGLPGTYPFFAISPAELGETTKQVLLIALRRGQQALGSARVMTSESADQNSAERFREERTQRRPIDHRKRPYPEAPRAYGTNRRRAY